MTDIDSPPRNPRTEETRAQLIEAAFRLFAMRGYEGVTTRELSRAAGVNLAAIAYHFGGKKGLYLAVVEALVQETGPRLGHLHDTLASDVAAAAGDRARLAAAAARFIGGLIKGFLVEPRLRWRASLVLREYSQPSDAFEIFYKGRVEPLHKALTDLAAAALGRAADDPESIIRAHALLGQLMSFGVTRTVLWRRLGWPDDEPANIDHVARSLTAAALALLELPPVAAGGA